MDNVTKPAHYSGEGIECIDVIEAALGPEGFRDFCLGNVIKYSWRHKLKGGQEDLDKAKVYRGWMRLGTASNRPRSATDWHNWQPLGDYLERLESKRDTPDLPPAVAELMDRSDEDAPTAHLKAGEANP